ncbi:MAG TPA: trehalose-phosphatase [Candidatus Dormibacteraeota bacterium]|nr:trehalose-phosphatase [Candidatus Dormibacteraeota bacterium]
MIQPELDEITRLWGTSALAQLPPGEVILVTDFDGTLAEVVEDPAAARARPEALQALSQLAYVLADVIVLSSRTPAQLESLVPLDHVRRIGDSGLAMPRHAQKEALDRFNAETARLLEHIPGAWVEIKPASTAVHFRNTDLSGDDMLRLLGPVLEGTRLEAALGRKVVEVHAPKAGKGSALAHLLPGEDPGGVVCFGDDENDRSMFDYVSALDIPHMCVGVWSPEAPADLFDRCDMVVHGPAGAAAVLEEILDWASRRVWPRPGREGPAPGC